MTTDDLDHQGEGDVGLMINKQNTNAQVYLGMGILLLIGLIGFAIHQGWFFVTGAQFYKSCWEQRAAMDARASGDFKEPKAGNPQQASLWAQCAPITFSGMVQAGMELGSSDASASEERQKLAAFCPDLDRDLPLFLELIYTRAVDWVQAIGGPSLIDSFIPAEWLVARAATARWPNCRDNAKPIIAALTKGKP